MRVKTVDTVVSTDSIGRPVDAFPVRQWQEGDTDATGRPVDPVFVTEDPNGLPVRFVEGAAALNSAGQWIDSLPVVGAGLAWRAHSQGCFPCLAINTGQIGATTRAAATRSMHRAPHRFAKIKVVYPLYTTQLVSSPTRVADVPFPAAVTYQCAIEASPVQALTDLAPRIVLPFDGQPSKRWPANPTEWLAMTDEFNVADVLGRYIEADELFALHSCIQLDNGVSATNNLPIGLNVSAAQFQRFEGARTSTGDMIAAGDPVSAASYTGYTTLSRTGVTGTIRPLFFAVEAPKTFISMACHGDSISQDQVVGYGLNPALYDASGDARGNRSWWCMGADRLGAAYVNLSRGSDGDKFLIDPANWQGRRAALIAANPAVVDNTNGMNDTDAAGNDGTMSWSSGASLPQFAVFQTNSKFYMVTAAGTAGTTAPNDSALGVEFAHGTAKLVYLGPRTNGGTGGRAWKAYVTFAWKAKVNALIREAVPTAYIRNMMPLLKATSTDNFVSDGGTALTDYAASLSSRARMRELMQEPALRPWLGCDEVYDVAAATETSAGSGVFKTSGQSQYVIHSDGTHPVDEGHRLMALMLPAPPGV